MYIYGYFTIVGFYISLKKFFLAQNKENIYKNLKKRILGEISLG